MEEEEGEDKDQLGSRTTKPESQDLLISLGIC